MLRLKLQYFWHLMRRVDSLEKTLMLGGIGGGVERDDRGWDGWMASPTQWRWVWVNSGSWWWIGRPGVLRFMGLQRVGHDWATEVNWTDGWISKKNQVYNCYFRLKLINSICFHLCILRVGHISCGSLSLSRVQLFATPWTLACQAPMSMEFSRQEYWSGLLFPSPGDLPNWRIKPGSPALQADSLPPESPGKPWSMYVGYNGKQHCSWPCCFLVGERDKWDKCFKITRGFCEST